VIRRRRREERFDIISPNTTTPQAVADLRATQAQLSRVRARWPRVNAIAAELQRELEENDFAGRFRSALGG
jgi:hypothetical protein